MVNLLTKNEGNVDRIVRVIVGISLLSLVFIGPQTLWGLVGLVPLLTGASGRCPVYSIGGMSTCSAKRASGST